jgi:hypothetical protein
MVVMLWRLKTRDQWTMLPVVPAAHDILFPTGQMLHGLADWRGASFVGAYTASQAG